MFEAIFQIFSIAAGAGLVQWLYTRKERRREARAEATGKEWEIYKEQLAAEREHVRFKDERISELLKMNEEKEGRFIEQTQRLRDTQARELEANEARIKMGVQLAEANAHAAELERDNGELRLRIQRGECVKLGCVHRDPPNEFTKKAIEQKKRREEHEG